MKQSRKITFKSFKNGPFRQHFSAEKDKQGYICQQLARLARK